MKKFILASVLLTSVCSANAQDPAGNAFHIDYDQFQIDNVIHLINCGNDASLNVGANMTMEIWLRPYSTAWNQKLAGKVNSNFNSGYMMAIDQGKLYPEIWTPGQSQLLSGFLPPTPSPYYWVHLAISYDGSVLRAYVNGEEVGQTNTSGAVADNTDPFIIGVAPWGGMDAFQAFGDFDELRLWNTVRTEQELLDNMFISLNGTEPGLVAYYDFNVNTGTNLPDLTANGNDGTVAGTMVASGWEPSRAVLGDASMSGQNDINALWNATGFSDPRFVTTTNGLSLLASGIPDYDYIVFGHDNGSGVSTTDNPTGAPADFEHSGRSWYLNNVGGFASDMIFDLTNVADGGTVLDASQPAENYTLLHRTGTSGAYTAVGSGNTISGNIVTFSTQLASDGYYAIGVASTQTYNDASINENNSFEFGLYPNPADDQLFVQLPFVMEGQLSIFNSLGQIVLTQALDQTENQSMEIENLASGVYSVVISTENKLTARKQLTIE